MLKPCPFCGTIPYLKRNLLWSRGPDGSTHGYYNCHEYVVSCPNPKCGCRINLSNNNTIYNTDEEARQNAINAWNKRFKEEEE